MESRGSPAVEEFFHERDGELWCEGVRLAEIGDEVDTPCYVYSGTSIRERYRAFSAAFAQIPARIFYSVKANHNLAVLRLLRELGAGADVVSLGELYRARLADFQPHDIIFGGVGKRRDELEAALTTGVFLINVESERELRLINELAAALQVQAQVAVRVNPGVEASTHDYTQTGHSRTKFGVALGDASGLFGTAKTLSNVELVGVDAHIGSQIHTTDPYLETLRRLADFISELREQGTELRYFDIGGGFGVPYEGGPEIDLSIIADAAGELASRFDLMCLLEPGRWLVSPAGILLTRVLYEKKMGDRTYYVTDAGSNDFMRPSYYGAYHPISTVKHGAATTVADVVGPVCESGDFLGLERLLPQVSEGDLLVVFFAGAYGSVMSSNYNSRTRPAEVLVRGSEFEIVRRRESLEDIVAAEEPPS